MFPDPGSLAFSKMAGCSPAPASPMPQYVAKRRQVWALEIENIHRTDGKYTMYFTNRRFKPKVVEPHVIADFIPSHGDYFVVNSDGRQSFMPQELFHETYRPDR